MQQPSSSKQRTQMWSRRFVLVSSASFLALPFLVGLAVYIHDDRGFWTVVGYIFVTELSVMSCVLVASSVIPSVRKRLEIPDISGDERERMIALKAANFAYISSTALLLPAALGFMALKAGGKSGGIPPESFLYLMLVIQMSFYGSLIYYGRKM